MNIFTPKNFLRVSGLILLLISLLGFTAFLGPVPDKSVFGALWWFDNSEITAYAAVGAVSFIASFVFPPVWQRYLTLLIGIASLLAALYGVISPNLLSAYLERPADLIFLLVLGLWAMYAGLSMGMKRSKV